MREARVYEHMHVPHPRRLISPLVQGLVNAHNVSALVAWGSMNVICNRTSMQDMSHPRFTCSPPSRALDMYSSAAAFAARVAARPQTGRYSDTGI